MLSKCASEKYYIISQPELTASKLSKSAPHLRNALNHESTKASLAVSEVVGLKAGDRDELVKFIREKCGAQISNKFVEDARYGPREFVTQQWEPMIGGWTESEEKIGQSGELSIMVQTWLLGILLTLLLDRPWTPGECTEGPRKAPSVYFHSPLYTFHWCSRGS